MEGVPRGSKFVASAERLARRLAFFNATRALAPAGHGQSTDGLNSTSFSPFRPRYPRRATRHPGAKATARSARPAVRKKFGRDACKPLNRIGREALRSRFHAAGSVFARSGRGCRSAREESLAGLRVGEANQAPVVLKIRVSVVRFRPWPPLPIFLNARGFRHHRRTIGARAGAKIGRPSDYRKSDRSRWSAVRSRVGRAANWRAENLESCESARPV